MKNNTIFRGIRTDNGKIVYGSLFENGSCSFILSSKPNSSAHGHEYYGDNAIRITGVKRVIPESVGIGIQYKDKNGKQIFEGQCVDYRDKSWLVFIKKDGQAWLSIGGEWYGEGCYEWVKIDWDECEITKEYPDDDLV